MRIFEQVTELNLDLMNGVNRGTTREKAWVKDQRIPPCGVEVTENPDGVRMRVGRPLALDMMGGIGLDDLIGEEPAMSSSLRSGGCGFRRSVRQCGRIKWELRSA
jgi:hypothetical protein